MCSRFTDNRFNDGTNVGVKLSAGHDGREEEELERKEYMNREVRMQMYS